MTPIRRPRSTITPFADNERNDRTKLTIECIRRHARVRRSARCSSRQSDAPVRKARPANVAVGRRHRPSSNTFGRFHGLGNVGEGSKRSQSERPHRDRNCGRAPARPLADFRSSALRARHHRLDTSSSSKCSSRPLGRLFLRRSKDRRLHSQFACSRASLLARFYISVVPGKYACNICSAVIPASARPRAPH
jgi:hypothetical protein